MNIPKEKIKNSNPHMINSFERIILKLFYNNSFEGKIPPAKRHYCRIFPEIL